ncbi:hypothetical protein PIB30_041207 [Stylosanthes scabra]|uniref:Uncharacterized protein n=1 Tax=Stylosanthes scabra TaxID=79078 RepID=A0ABU6ZDK6_9FABA|nr:hypothetical protein [Stylosanthes scabra]
MPYPPVDNPLPEGEEEDITAEEAAATQAGRVYLRWDRDNCSVRLRWYVPQFSQAPEHVVQFWWDHWRSFFRLQRGYELKIYESWQQRASKRLRELFHEIRKKGAPHGWIPEDIFGRLVEFWWQDDLKR